MTDNPPEGVACCAAKCKAARQIKEWRACDLHNEGWHSFTTHGGRIAFLCPEHKEAVFVHTRALSQILPNWRLIHLSHLMGYSIQELMEI